MRSWHTQGIVEWSDPEGVRRAIDVSGQAELTSDSQTPDHERTFNFNLKSVATRVVDSMPVAHPYRIRGSLSFVGPDGERCHVSGDGELQESVTRASASALRCLRFQLKSDGYCWSDGKESEPNDVSLQTS